MSEATERAGKPIARRLPSPRTLDWLTAAGVLALCAIVQLALLQGPHPFDPARYFKAAVDFPDVPPNLWTLRIGLLAPVRVAVLVFGPSEAALYAVPLATGLLLAAAVYGTMLVLFGDRVLAAATALATVLNVAYLYRASFIFPDTVATATFAAGFLCLVLGVRRTGEEGNARAQLAFAAAAGALFGWTYLIREFSPLLLPAVLAALVILHYRVRRAVALVSAALTTVALELLYGAVRYGDPLKHVHLLLERRDRPGSPRIVRIAEHLRDELDSPLATVAVFPRLLLSWTSGWVFILLLAVFAAALVALRDRRLWVLAPWLFGFWAVMALVGLGSLPSGRWILNITNIRYWYPVLPALVMGGFGGLFLLVRRFGPRSRGLWLAPAAAAVVAGMTVAPGIVEFKRCAAAGVWNNDPAARWHELRSWLATREADRYDTIWTDPNTERLVPAFTSGTFGGALWRGRVERFERGRRPLGPEGGAESSLILLHRDRFFNVFTAAPAAIDELRRSGWAPIFATADGNMLLLAHRPEARVAPARAEPWWRRPRRLVQAPTCGLNPYAPAAPA